jgi:hypothetical protein
MIAARVRYFVHETLPWAVAGWLPRKIALFAFIRVYAGMGDCGPDYKRAYDAWEQGHGR